MLKLEEFWAVVDKVHHESEGDMDRKCELLKQELETWDAGRIMDFVHRFDALRGAAYTWPLWGAAFVIGGGCSDDGFIDFRVSLISRGRSDFERALADPDALADMDVDEDDLFHEGFQYVADEVYEAKTGCECPRKDSREPAEPAGDPWDEDEVDALFPRLAARFGG